MAADPVILNCARIRKPDLQTIDELARLQLGLRRAGCELCLAGASAPLRELIDFAGLAGVLRVQAGRQAEQRKELRRVEKERELGNAPA